MSFLIELYESVYTHVTSDPVLQDLFGGTVKLYNQMAPPNVDFPYITFEAEDDKEDEDDLITSKTYLIFDIWWRQDHANALTLRDRLLIQDRLKKLLHKKYFVGSSGTARFWYEEAYSKKVFVTNNIPEVEIRCTTVEFCVRIIDSSLNEEIRTPVPGVDV